MRKHSLSLIVLGVAVLLGAFFLIQGLAKPQGEHATTSGPVEIAYRYISSAPYTGSTTRLEGGREAIITVTSDVADEVHLHGYDRSVDVAPGREATLRFTANNTGRFIIELERLKKELGAIEVYPR